MPVIKDTLITRLSMPAGGSPLAGSLLLLTRAVNSVRGGGEKWTKLGGAEMVRSGLGKGAGLVAAV